jgi:hypothetical protein
MEGRHNKLVYFEPQRRRGAEILFFWVLHLIKDLRLGFKGKD